MYFIYRWEVSRSKGLINPFATADFIRQEILAENECNIPIQQTQQNLFVISLLHLQTKYFVKPEANSVRFALSLQGLLQEGSLHEMS